MAEVLPWESSSVLDPAPCPRNLFVVTRALVEVNQEEKQVRTCMKARRRLVG